jgi:uncharacterized protein
MEIKIACPGYEISTEWYEGKDHSRILIILPGYSSSKARQRIHAEAMVQTTGTNALVVDFSGHGISPFELRDTRPGQHLLELICVLDWIKQQYPVAEISISGSSYGGFLAVHLTGYREFRNLILRAAAIYEPTAMYDLWSIRIDNPEQYNKRALAYRSDAEALAVHPLLNYAKAFKGNTLVVVHENDEIVPIETSNAYIDAFKADSIIAKGFVHTIDKANVDDVRLQEYQDQIAAWLSRH